MKNMGINFIRLMMGSCFVLSISGCISVHNSLTPRFYMLEAVDKNQAEQKGNVAFNAIVGIGPIKIPEYQDRPQMVTQGTDRMLKFAQFDRWGESLNIGIGRLLREDLTVMLPNARFTLYPWNTTLAVKYQVAVEIVQLDSVLDKDLLIVVQWMVIDVQNAKTLLIKRSEFRQPIIPQNYSGVAKTLSTACMSLSHEIAEAMTALEKQSLVIPRYN